MTTHVMTSHGADFFGEDHHPVKLLRDLGQQVRGVLPYAELPPLTQLLDSAGAGPVTLLPDRAADVSALFLAAANHRLMKPKFAAAARLLADAAARAAADDEPWTWTPTDES
ncbi:hypothetical protein AB0M86_45155 [Streptomyces sp. NPDC051639]|uniref:DUF7739 domain-containing protein n=1 Tax=Streptomyces sp. NPDC051639 TaxID=3155671 RepID=UPI003438516B